MHSSQILAEHGWRVLFVGIKASETDNLRLTLREGIELRQLNYCSPGWRQKLHYTLFIIYTWLLVLLWRPKWIYASDPFSSIPALLLSYWPTFKIIYHEHDSPMEEKTTWFLQLVFATRKKLARRADICILPNQNRADIFARELSNGHTVCVWNCPSLEETAWPKARENDGDVWLLYHGTIVPARLPFSVLYALQKLPERVKLRVVGYETIGHRGYVQQLRETAKELGLSERVEFMGTIPTRKELLEVCRKSDIGMAFMPLHDEDINMKNMTGASNKPFDYLACGLALLVSDLPDWRKLFVEPGYALACDIENSQSIAEAVRWYLDHPVEMQHMGERGRQRIISNWNYESQFSPILERISK